MKKLFAVAIFAVIGFCAKAERELVACIDITVWEEWFIPCMCGYNYIMNNCLISENPYMWDEEAQEMVPCNYRYEMGPSWSGGEFGDYEVTFKIKGSEYGEWSVAFYLNWAMDPETATLPISDEWQEVTVKLDEYIGLMTHIIWDCAYPGTFQCEWIKIFRVTNGISEACVPDQAPEYFNLQGIRVENPTSGIYIVKQGDKISKQKF